MWARILRVCAVLLLLGSVTAGSSSADPIVIYTNFGPDPGYIVPTSGSGRYSQSDTNLYSMGFELSDPAHLTSVTLPVAFAGQLTDGVRLWIFADPPAAGARVIEEWRLDVPAGAQPGTASVLTAHSVLRPVLAANTLYFLAMYSAGGYDVISWPWNNAGIEGTVALSGPGPPPRLFTGTLGAFQLNGEQAPIPEPGTMLLLATGAGLVLQRVRRRRRA